MSDQIIILSNSEVNFSSHSIFLLLSSEDNSTIWKIIFFSLRSLRNFYLIHWCSRQFWCEVVGTSLKIVRIFLSHRVTRIFLVDRLSRVSTIWYEINEICWFRRKKQLSPKILEICKNYSNSINDLNFLRSIQKIWFLIFLFFIIMAIRPYYLETSQKLV